MPCGPLQMVQLYALGTGSVFYGASVLFIFSIGTMPVLFLFGLINTLINKNHSKIILKASAVFVLILGFVMVNRGLALSGINFDIMAFVKSENKGWISGS
jgi:sulfite exporter TauE/SafE